MDKVERAENVEGSLEKSSDSNVSAGHLLADHDNSFQVLRSTKTVVFPCTRNKCSTYAVKVPRRVSEQIPRTVKYTSYETRKIKVPYTVNRRERRINMETQKYQVPVTTSHVKMVSVTKKEPKTV